MRDEAGNGNGPSETATPTTRAARGYCRKCGASPTHAELLPRNDGTAGHIAGLRVVGGGAPLCGPVATHWFYMVRWGHATQGVGRSFMKLDFELAHVEEVEAVEATINKSLPQMTAVDRETGAAIVGTGVAAARAVVSGWELLRVESADVWLRQ